MLRDGRVCVGGRDACADLASISLSFCTFLVANK